MLTRCSSGGRDFSRVEAHNDYLINQKAEEEIRAVLNHLAAQDEALSLICQRLLALREQNDEGASAPSQLPDQLTGGKSQGDNMSE